MGRRSFRVWGEAVRHLQAGEREEKKFIWRALGGLVSGIAIVLLILSGTNIVLSSAWLYGLYSQLFVEESEKPYSQSDM